MLVEHSKNSRLAGEQGKKVGAVSEDIESSESC